MVSGFNHLHIDAGEVMLDSTENIHHLTSEERSAFNSFRMNSKPIYLTVSATCENIPVELSIMLNLFSFANQKFYSALADLGQGVSVFTIAYDTDGPFLYMQFNS